MKVVCVSDTHLNQPKVPDGDVLIHAGDLTLSGKFPEIARAGLWLKSLPHPLKIVIAGNHDWLFARDMNHAKLALDATGELIYLQDQSHVFDHEGRSWKVYGSPWQPRFFDWAFNLDRGEPLARKWAAIPDDTDILVTHGPVYGRLDMLPRGEMVGCKDLRKRVEEVRPTLHVCGHIHCAHGRQDIDGTTYVNAALCDDMNRLRHEPIVVEI